MKVVIIDDGLNNELYDFKIEENYSLLNNNGIKEKCFNPNSHGSICAYIINSLCKNVSFIGINIFKNKKAKIKDIISALNLCLLLNVNVIHLSIGVIEIDRKNYINLNNIIDALIMQNKIIVASISAQLHLTYPGSLPKVIGVCHTNFLKKDEVVFEQNNLLGIKCFCNGKVLIYNRYGKEIEYVGSSFAAPQITAKIINNEIDTDKLCTSVLDFYALDNPTIIIFNNNYKIKKKLIWPKYNIIYIKDYKYKNIIVNITSENIIIVGKYDNEMEKFINLLINKKIYILNTSDKFINKNSNDYIDVKNELNKIKLDLFSRMIISTQNIKEKKGSILVIKSNALLVSNNIIDLIYGYYYCGILEIKKLKYMLKISSYNKLLYYVNNKLFKKYTKQKGEDNEIK